ncbi:probable basic-leucine zipper transcription factor E [Musca vetustissima]|uniref:probable basic-leucine zipper transcription factor E n=1 Tax=Musca vetustissima TaxID=27455 RepID=UPI002AB7922D|nr:probable basic-leucine zipper transcription factor E [Musca vetustissima]
MLFPDETYEDYYRRISLSKTHTDLTFEGNVKKVDNTRKTASSGSSGHESSCTNSNSGSYKRTNDFFDNIPEIEEETAELFDRNQEKNHKDDTAKQFRNNINEDDSTDLSTNPRFLRYCEAIIQQYRIRPDFFCQYYKAISNSQSASSSSGNTPLRNKQKKQISNSSREQSLYRSPGNPITVKTSSSSEEMVQRFTKRSAIYTLPMTKRKSEVLNKTLNNGTPVLVVYGNDNNDTNNSNKNNDKANGME